MNLVRNALQEYGDAAMSGLLRVSPEPGFTAEDLADLPHAFPPCLIRDGKIARADGLPLEWEQYDQLGEGFPATLTEDGELQMSPRPTPAHEGKATNLFTLLNHFSTCQREGKTYFGPELRIRPYRRTLVPDLMFFKNPKAQWNEESVTHIDQVPDLAVEIVSPSNKGKKWEDNLAFYRQAGFTEFWLVQLDGAVEHALPRVNLIVVAKAPIERVLTFAKERGWRRLRLLSSAKNTYNRDYHAEGADGVQRPMLNVFSRDGGQIRHFWSSEMFFAPTDPGQDPRHVGTIEPVWNLFDLTREGRKEDWDEQLQYPPAHRCEHC